MGNCDMHVLNRYSFVALLILGAIIISPPVQANPLSEATVTDINFYKYPRTAPNAKLKDKEDKDVTLSDYKGKVLVLNIWSRRCGPCIKELPMLDALQKEMDKEKFMVIAATQDWKNGTNVKEYLDVRSLSNLEPMADYSGRLVSEVGVMTYPVTIIINKKGMEIGRLRGAADWNNSQIRGMLINLYKENANEVEEVQPKYGWQAQPSKTDAKPWVRQN